MANTVPNRGGAWRSAWPAGHPNHTNYVSPEQETANARSAKAPKKEYKTIPDRDNPKSGTMHTPSEYKAKYGWVSPYPYGHPNFQHAQ